MFASWLIINPIYLSRAVDSMDEDDRVEVPASTNGSAPIEIRQLRADVDQSLARAGR